MPVGSIGVPVAPGSPPVVPGEGDPVVPGMVGVPPVGLVVESDPVPVPAGVPPESDGPPDPHATSAHTAPNSTKPIERCMVTSLAS
jgi:hypothetical protein